jgi:acetyl esterase/lipase
VSDQHARIDPQSREPLEQLLAVFPGGFNAIADIVARREAVANLLQALAADLPPNDNVVVEDRTVPGPEGAPDVPVRIYRPAAATGVLPAVFYIHGGGMVIGSLDGEHLSAQMLCERLGALVVSTGYRKAPEHPHPAQVSDCYAALTWMGANAADLGYDADRLAIYGGSAGGNLCIATAMMARDNGGPALRLMMAPYPMVDHRNVLPSTVEVTEVGIWDRSANIEAWAWFLGGQEPDDYAAPLHAADLSGLPPAYIDVGTVDMFRDEDLALVGRLLEAGNPVEFHLSPGAYHASEVFAPEAELSARIWALRLGALGRALA